MTDDSPVGFVLSAPYQPPLGLFLMQRKAKIIEEITELAKVDELIPMSLVIELNHIIAALNP